MYKLKEDLKNTDSNKLYDLFFGRLKKLEVIESITKKAKYKIIERRYDNIKFLRINTSIKWEIQKELLINVFNFIKENNFNTTTLRINKLVPRRQSPTIALLIATKMVKEWKNQI
jgi:hypothetical protein